MVCGHRIIRIACAVFLLLVLGTGVCVAGHGEKRPDRTGILLVAFGTTVPEARAGFDAVQKAVAKAFPDIDLFWAYTSSMVRNKVEDQEGTTLLSPAEALAGMADAGYTRIAVLSLHVIPGAEYHDLLRTCQSLEGVPGLPARITISPPLLATSHDVQAAATALLGSLPARRAAGDAVVLMGHGSHHPADVYYAALQYHLRKLDPLVFVGTVEGVPTLEDVERELAASGAGTVYLLPFMAVAGDHAMNDMAGDGDDSWKSVLTARGYEVIPVLTGAAEYPALVDLWVDHLRSAMSHFEQ